MQEEVTQKTIALSMKTGKLTAQALQAALKKYLQHRAKGPKLHHGKQSLKQLKAHGAALTNIEVTEANIGAFKPCAKKYGVDFTLRKDKTTQPPHYIVIFKAKDTDNKQNLFQSERVIIGKCPRCSENVYEGKKNFYCGNRSCQFVMWKNDRFFEQRKKAFTPKIAAALLKNGKAKVKGLYSEKTGKTYDATVLLADTGGKYVNYRVERKE